MHFSPSKTDDGAPGGLRIIERTFEIPELPPMSPGDRSRQKAEMAQIRRSEHHQRDLILNAVLERDPEYLRFMRR